MVTTPDDLREHLRILEDAIPRLRGMGVTYFQVGDVSFNLSDPPGPEPQRSQSDQELEEELGDFLNPDNFRRAPLDGEDAS